MNRNPLIVALDVESAGDARALVRALGSSVEFYKVGLELYAAAGMAIIRELLDGGKQVFLDLKFYDIPETVRRAVAQVARSGARFLTVHAVDSVMRAAVEGKAGSPLQILAVTVLTSFGKEDLAGLGCTCPASELWQPARSRPWPRASKAWSVPLSKSPPSAPSPDPMPSWSRPACDRRAPPPETRSAWPRPPRPSAMAPITWSSDGR